MDNERNLPCDRQAVWGRFCFGGLDIQITGARPRRITRQGKPVSNRKL